LSYKDLQISLVAAVATNGVIGNRGQLAWHIPEDLKHFQSLTNGGIVVMGRVTYLSIPDNHRPFANRTSVVISAKSARKNISTNNLQWCSNPIEALNWCCDNAKVDQTIWVIGGRGVFESMMQFIRRAVITRIPFAAKGDVIFSPLPAEFQIVKKTKIDLANSILSSGDSKVDNLLVEWYERRP
jgi:dihydrofolate reductase